MKDLAYYAEDFVRASVCGRSVCLLAANMSLFERSARPAVLVSADYELTG